MKIRDYTNDDELEWLRCRVFSFLDCMQRGCNFDVLQDSHYLYPGSKEIYNLIYQIKKDTATIQEFLCNIFQLFDCNIKYSSYPVFVE